MRDVLWRCVCTISQRNAKFHEHSCLCVCIAHRFAVGFLCRHTNGHSNSTLIDFHQCHPYRAAIITVRNSTSLLLLTPQLLSASHSCQPFRWMFCFICFWIYFSFFFAVLFIFRLLQIHLISFIEFLIRRHCGVVRFCVASVFVYCAHTVLTRSFFQIHTYRLLCLVALSRS